MLGRIRPALVVKIFWSSASSRHAPSSGLRTNHGRPNDDITTGLTTNHRSQPIFIRQVYIFFHFLQSTAGTGVEGLRIYAEIRALCTDHFLGLRTF